MLCDALTGWMSKVTVQRSTHRNTLSRAKQEENGKYRQRAGFLHVNAPPHVDRGSKVMIVNHCTSLCIHISENVRPIGICEVIMLEVMI